MSHAEWTLPQLPAGLNKSKAESKRKKAQRIPSMGIQRGNVSVPDDVVAAIKWLHLQGFTASMIDVVYPGHARNYVYNVIMGITRRHVEPRAPIWINEAMWHQRDGSSTLKEGPNGQE